MTKIDYTFCELRDREIINVADGKRLGRVGDVAMDCKGMILGFIVPSEKKFFKSITGGDNIYIPWNCILKIGSDVILVDLNMYQVAAAYTDFYEKCRVIDQDGKGNWSRLVFCEMTRQALRLAFQILGLKAVEKM